MKWNLLFSDMLARLVGIVGLFASAIFLVGALDGLMGNTPFLALFGGLTLFSFILSFVFLFPSLHDTMMEATLNRLFRWPYVVICFLWAITIAVGLMVLIRSIGVAIDIGLLNWLWPAASAFPVIALAVIIFPMGLGYRDAETETHVEELGALEE